MSKVSNSNSTYLLSSSNQHINSNWQQSIQTIQKTFPFLYNKINIFQKDNSNMLKNTLLNNYISNSPPKSKMAFPEKKVSINDYQILDTIGKGSCGFVKLAKRKSDGKNVIIKYVVKSLVLDGCWTREDDSVKIPTEIHILKYITENFPHPYVLRLLNTWEDNYYYYLEFDSQNCIDLFECIDNRRFTTEAQVKKIFYRIVQGVQHLHHINIVHRDIKDENILIRDDDTVEIIDFGSSAYVKEGKKFEKFCGTGGYAAPEVLSGQKYDGPPQDIWSLGILLYTMIYGSNPFRTLDQIITSEVQFPVIVSNGSHDLMCRMLNRDFQKRPNIDEVINHPWFDDLSEEDKQIPKNRQIHNTNIEMEIKKIDKIEIISKEEIEHSNNNSIKKSNPKINNEEEEEETEMDNISVEILTPLENEKDVESVKSEEDENELTLTTINEDINKKLDLNSLTSSEECDIRSDSTLVD